MKNLKNLLLLSLFILMMSCTKENNSTDFSFHVNSTQTDNTSSFVMLSNQNGDILYQSTDLNIQDVSIEQSKNDIIDLTYGVETGNFAKVTTFRDVKSGFFNSQFGNCLLDLNNEQDFKVIPSVFHGVTIEVSNVPAYDELYFNGFVQDNGGILYLLTTKDGADRIITILPKNESTYLSYKVRDEDLIEFDGKITLKLDFNFFKPSYVQEIATNRSDYWISNNISYRSDNGKRVWLGASSQSGLSNTILFVTVKGETNIRDVHMNAIGLSYSFSKHFDEIPSKIDLTDFELAIDGSVEHFDFSSDRDFDLAIVSYIDSENDHVSVWDIFQRPESSKSYNLPTIPSSLIKDSPILQRALKSFDNPSLKCVDVLDNTKVFAPTSFLGLECIDYVGQTVQ